MLRYVLSRLASAVAIALLATFVVFSIVHLAPGDPVLAQLGDIAASDPAFVAEFRAKWGLDQPFWQQYLVFLQRLLQGDLGTSITSQRPVMDDIIQYAPATIELASVGFILGMIIGIPLGIAAAVWRDSWVDHVARFVSLAGVSSPSFWLAFVLLSLFYGGLQIAPGPGRLDMANIPPPTVTGFFLIDTMLEGDWEVWRSAAAHLILPSIVLAAATLGLITRVTRASMLETLDQDYVRVARATGASGAEVVLRHALPNALIPIVTLSGLIYSQLLTGAVMTETIFSWPGLGRYTFLSTTTLDVPAIMGVTLLVAAVYLLINLLVDLSYPFLDPRTERK
jgi:peptide/nickel transport system permease protein